MTNTQVLKNSEIRPTPARTAILSFLNSVKHPVTIAEILSDRDVKKVDMDQVTAYRVIERFLQENVVKRIEFHEGKFRYELTGRSHHHHAVCTSCGKIIDVTDCLDKSIEANIEKRTGFSITNHSLEFFGLCPDCKMA